MSAARTERRALIQFTAREALLGKLEKIRSIASHRLSPNASFEEVIEFVADHFIEREDPTVRHERRESRQQVAPTLPRGSAKVDTPSRHIPSRVRDQVFVRDQGRCAYVSPGGKRCNSTHVLQVDHVQPFARGGPSTPENLRLLCAQHNRLEAERLMGCGAP